MLHHRYASYKALSTPGTQDDAQWLTYWVVYAGLTSAEAIVQSLFLYVPLYYELKLVGLLWLMTPQTKGAQLLYEKFINPFLTQHAAKFDPVFATTKLAIDNAQVDKLVALAQQYGPDITRGAINQAALELKRQSASGEINSRGDFNNQRAPQTNDHQRAPQTNASQRVPQSGNYNQGSTNVPRGMPSRY
ncbi:hypothetical protein ABBQ38_001755 [Trebouxia sp. C0009 RCD-2024]